MNDYERIARPTYVPPLMLKIVAANLALWLVVLPLVLAIRIGISPQWLTVAACGVPLIGAVLLGLFISRLIAFGYYTLFWFWQGLLALAGMTMGVLAFVAIVFFPERIPADFQPMQFTQSDQFRHVFAGMLPGAMIGASITIAAVLTVWMMRRGKQKQSGEIPHPVQMPVPQPAAPPKKKELNYLNDWNSRK